MAKDDGSAKQYDAVKGEWVAASKEQAAVHFAVAEGLPLPGDRTEDDMRRLEPGMANAVPVATTGDLADVTDGAPARAGRGGNA